MKISQLRLATKLWLAVATLILALLLLLGYTANRSATVTRHAESATAAAQARVQAATRWAGLTETNAARTQALVMSADPAMEAAFKDVMAATSAEISKMHKAMDTAATSPADQAQLARIAQSRATMIALRAQARELRGSGNVEAATAFLKDRYNPSVSAYLGNLRALVDLQEVALEEVKRTTQTARNVTVYVAAASVVFIVLAILTGAWLLIRSIVVPLAQANRIAARIAGGDLSAQPEVSRRDEFGDLLRSLSAMGASLGRMVHQVRQSTDSIATASAEIAMGNNDLSVRTEQTSANLQATASSMDHLTQTVHQSADSANQASSLAANASRVAEKGGQVVEQVVATMQQINSSSKKIADIIGTIDGIAFQTNILALNAAVEAARAGEQGRGFAVVASEVRSLAQRSAQAAREIKGLIGDSVEKVDSGARLVADAGATMTDIVQSVKRVTDMINEITAAATEQSAGIADVNQSIGKLDQMTQQNAALVEQSAAAAQSLREQADQLTGVVAQFNTGHAGPVAFRPAPLPAPMVAPPVPARPALSRPALSSPRPAVLAPARAAAPRTAVRPAMAAAGDSSDWETF